MKALVHDGNGNIAIEDRPEPTLVDPNDAIVRITRSTICTSDLHIIHGAVRAFEAREDDCLKMVITPWEER